MEPERKEKKRAILGGGLGIQEEIWELCPRCENGKPLTSWLLDSRGRGKFKESLRRPISKGSWLSGSEQGLWHHSACMQTMALSVISCVIQGKSLPLRASVNSPIR